LNITRDNQELIKRTSKKFIEQKLSLNQNWKILDIGCGYGANKYANVISDVQDLSEHYKDKNFVRIKEKKLPFVDKEFDFVIASHVLEHVDDIKFFISELERISSSGYIEVPTILEDNLVFENKTDHLWHMNFDDDKNILLITKKIQYFEPVLTVSTIKKFQEIFRKSLVLELSWENKIDYSILDIDLNKFQKYSIFTLFRKYISKKIRMIFK
jgi:ubiquinone/menaquinone biosynthesis C-methylase UbiE